jgi:acetolactate synthase-1/2/3 large subunit
MSAMTGAQMVVRALEDLGVRHIFGIPGGPVIPLYDALHGSPLWHLLTRHEQAAAHGADAYGRITGEPGVVIGTSGPGAMNLLTGIANAYLDSSPMVALVGQVPQGSVGTDAFQEADVMGATLSMVKHSMRARRPEEIPQLLKGAFTIASSGRKGPVLVELPVDVQRASGQYRMPDRVQFRGYDPSPAYDLSWVDEARHLLTRSERPLLLAGGGVVRAFAFNELMELVEETRIPVVTTLMGKGSISERHPLCLGMVGMHGSPGGNWAVTNADVILAVGVRFSDRTTGDRGSFARGASVIHVDADPSEFGKNISPTVRGWCDAKSALGALRRALGGWRAPADWGEAILGHTAHSPLPRGDGMSHPWEVMEALSEVAGGGLYTTEVGQHQMWAAMHLKVERPGSFITSGGLGTMGFGLPAAMGCALASPGDRVICIAGDGSLMMNVQELDTLARYNLPVKVVLLNNRCLGMVRQWQELFFQERYSNTIYNRSPDFPCLAEAMGVRGLRCERPGELRGRLEEMMGLEGPCLLEVPIPQEDLVLPMVPAGEPLERVLTHRHRL